MWWCNEEIKNTIAKKKAACKEPCRFPSEKKKDLLQTFKKSSKKNCC